MLLNTGQPEYQSEHSPPSNFVNRPREHCATGTNAAVSQHGFYADQRHLEQFSPGRYASVVSFRGINELPIMKSEQPPQGEAGRYESKEEICLFSAWLKSTRSEI